MLPHLTPAVNRALETGRLWAARAGAEIVTPEHLFLALLEDEEGRAAILLKESGFCLSAYRQAVVAPDPRITPASASVVSLGPECQDALARAHTLAANLSGDRSVASEHLLIGILQAVPLLREKLIFYSLDYSRLEELIQGAEEISLRVDEPLVLEPSTEEFQVSRIWDVGTNRAREALRVIEDYCRFALDDAFLTNELKQIRHQLMVVVNEYPANHLLEARDTRRDVGTTLETAAEYTRETLTGVVQANFKRLEESLRGLEEYGKLPGGRLARLLEQLRYQTYTLEQAIVLGASTRQRLAAARLYILLTGATCAAALDWTIQEAAAGGARMFQLREKNLPDRELLDRARLVRRWTRQANALFIMNDRPDIARLADADGVHIGQDELAVADVRRILGPGALVGVSTHNLDQVHQAVLDGASYIGVGPTFPSGTKVFTEYPGLDFVRDVSAATSLPAYVIGGITLENIHHVMAAGGTRVAVSQAICQAEEPRDVAGQFSRTLESGMKSKGKGGHE